VVKRPNSINNNNNNASISIAQNKLSSVALMAVQTNNINVFSLLAKVCKKQTQSKGLLANCSTQEQ